MKPLNSFTEWPKFAVMDIEASSWTNVMCLCHVDEYGENDTQRRKHYVGNDAVNQHIKWLFNESNVEFVWAHWGGRYDFRFSLYEFFKKGWSIETILSGNLIVVMEVTNKHGRKIKFCESARIMPDSVEAVGKSVGLPKLDVNRTQAELYSEDVLLTYCYRDCEIVLKGLQQMRDTFKKLDVDFAYTLASMMTRYVRRSKVLDMDRFLCRDENTGKRVLRPEFLKADAEAMRAHFGGRVEVFRGGRHRNLYYYDITSSYPYAMLHELPTYFLGTDPPIRKRGGQIDVERSLRERCGVTSARVWMPRNSMYMPILPLRLKNKIVFPTLEGLESTWTNIELLALWERMHKFDGFKMELTGQWSYQPMAFLKPFVELFWQLRQQAIPQTLPDGTKTKGDAFRKYAFKIALNSVSGKLAEQEWKESIVAGQAYNEAVAKHGLEAITASKVPGIYFVRYAARGPFTHFAAGAYITAMGRLNLHAGMEHCRKQGGKVYYCDTDSIMTNIKAFPEGDKQLGAWHLEYEIKYAEIWAAKNYMLELQPGTYDEAEYPGGCIYRAKGMPIEQRETKEDPTVARARWLAYTAKHQGLDLPKPIKDGLRGLKSDLANGHIFPQVFELKRSVQNVDTKRVHANDDSAPLHYDESLYERDKVHKSRAEKLKSQHARAEKHAAGARSKRTHIAGKKG